MKQIETKVFIEAPRETLWRELTNFGQYSEWNPFIIKGKGDAAVGSQLHLTMKNGKREMVFEPEVQVSDPNSHFEWLGSGMAGMFKGRHYFILKDSEGGTELIHGEKFTGLLSGMIFNMIKTETTAGFESMNQALKVRVEGNS